MPHANQKPAPPPEPAPTPPPSQDPEKTGNEHPNPPNSPKNDPTWTPTDLPEPDPLPQHPRHHTTLRTLPDLLVRELTACWENIPLHHLFTNQGTLKTPPPPRYRNTTMRYLSLAAIAHQYWTQTTQHPDNDVKTAFEAILRFTEPNRVHDFYHAHDETTHSLHYELGDHGLVTAHLHWEPGRAEIGHHNTDHTRSQPWNGENGTLLVEFHPDIDIFALLAEIGYHNTPPQ